MGLIISYVIVAIFISYFIFKRIDAKNEPFGIFATIIQGKLSSERLQLSLYRVVGLLLAGG